MKVWANIDHHRTNELFGDVQCVLPDECATGAVLYYFFKYLGIPVTPVMRDALYVAVSTDTGSFQYQMTTAAVMELAADLIRMGVDVQDINRQLYQEKPWVKMQLMREALNGMKLTPDGRICTFCLTNEAKARIGSRPEDTEGLIDLLRSVQGVWLAAYLEETEDDPRIRISLRSKTPEISVAELASRFGGGGHSMAAGVRIRGPIEEVRLTILKAMREEVGTSAPTEDFMNVSDSIQVPSGVLLIDKARDMTSHDVVAIARRSLGIKKIGHCGTLDPMATGLLMLVVGKATKLQDKLMCEHKEYAGTLMLGVETSSQDAMGEIVAEYSVDGVTEQAVREAFDRFDGAFEQIPSDGFRHQKGRGAAVQTGPEKVRKLCGNRGLWKRSATEFHAWPFRKWILPFSVPKVFMCGPMLMILGRHWAAERI